MSTWSETWDLMFLAKRCEIFWLAKISTPQKWLFDTAPTGIALIGRFGFRNSIVVVSGANMVWHLRDLARMKIEPSDIVVCQFEIPLEIIESVFTRAKKIGATTILNPAPIKPAT